MPSPSPPTTDLAAAPRLVTSALGAASPAPCGPRRPSAKPAKLSAGGMADKFDMESNPYEALGLGEGSAEVTLAQIKKVRQQKRKRRERWLCGA